MLRVTDHANKIPDDQRYCRCCEKRLKGRVAWLELDQRVDAYHDLGGVPEDQSQGWFPFGLTCARRLKEIGTAKLYLVLNNKVLAFASDE